MKLNKRKKWVRRKRDIKRARKLRKRIMTVNFFDPIHRRENTNERLFGVCDAPNTLPNPAYIDTINTSSWIATITNTHGEEVDFLPVDKNIPIFRPNGTMANRCDCIIFSQTGNRQDIIFLELKERTDKKNRVWRKEGVNQLSATIKVFLSAHGLNRYKHKRAIVANNKRPHYHYSNHVGKNEFAKKHSGIILSITPYISI